MSKLISPSLICTDLCNLESEIREIEALGATLLHVDIIDGVYSPDMPLGIETVRQLRKRTKLEFDVHLMSTNNAPYVDLLLQSGIQRLAFQTDYEKRPNILLRKIRAAGVKAGIAIAPETALESIYPLLPLCDFVLIMRIDAGYAHLSGQNVYPHADRKIAQLKAYAQENCLSFEIEVDGRVDLESMRTLAQAGADVFVSGSRGLFDAKHSRAENWKLMTEVLSL